MSQQPERQIPNLPNSPMTTADMGMTLFDLEAINDLLTKTDIPRELVELFTSGVSTAQALIGMGRPKTGARLLSWIENNLKLRVSIKGKRTDKLLVPFQYELHREPRRRDEEKPAI
jgi:hypothetical protein